jgi:hypothetical protein
MTELTKKQKEIIFKNRVVVSTISNDLKERRGIDVRDLLEMSVGKIIKWDKNNPGRREPVEFAFDQVSHVADWLVAARVNNEPWLMRVNPDGVPLKLAKMATFQQIVGEADKAMRKKNSRGFSGSAVGQVVHRFANDWTMVRLTTEEELDAESSIMQHCVGHGGYDTAAQSGKTGIYSLRDPRGKAHATIEIDHSNDSVEQVKGKQNRVPKREYFAMVAEWINANEFAFSFHVKDLPDGYSRTSDFRVIDVYALPEGEVFNGDSKPVISQLPRI